MRLHNRLLSVGCISSALVGGSLLHPVVSGQVTATTHQFAAIGQALVPAASLFVGLALLLGLVAFREHIPTVDRVVSSTTTKRVATVAVVGLVVTTAALSGVGGPASPVETVQAGYFEGCNFSDSLTFAVGASLGLSNQDCAVYTPDYQTDNIEHNDAYASAAVMGSSSDSYLTTSENFAQDSRSVAWSKAKISLVNDLNSNVSEANATENAKEKVDEYYFDRMENILNEFSGKSDGAVYLANATAADGEQHNGSVIEMSLTGGSPAATEAASVNYTFPDNRTVNITGAIIYYSSDNNYHPVGPDLNVVSGFSADVTAPSGYTLSDTRPSEYKIRAKAPDSSDSVLIVDTERYTQLLKDLNDQRTQVNANIATYANETYTAYNAGEINATDLASSDPTTIATQAATDYNSTGYYGLASAQLAAMGLSGNESVSHVVNTTENGSARTITGTLFYTGEDSQTFDTGTEYNPANLNGSVYMSVASIEDGTGTELNHSGGFYYVEEHFTIAEATNTQTGEAVNSTTMETRNYTTTNASLLAEEIDRLKEQRAFYEQQLAAGGGGIGFDFGGTGAGIGIALAAVVVLMIATRD